MYLFVSIGSQGVLGGGSRLVTHATFVLTWLDLYSHANVAPCSLSKVVSHRAVGASEWWAMQDWCRCNEEWELARSLKTELSFAALMWMPQGKKELARLLHWELSNAGLTHWHSWQQQLNRAKQASYLYSLKLYTLKRYFISKSQPRLRHSDPLRQAKLCWLVSPSVGTKSI